MGGKTDEERWKKDCRKRLKYNLEIACISKLALKRKTEKQQLKTRRYCRKKMAGGTGGPQPV